MPQSTGWIGVAQRSHAFLGSFGGEPGITGIQACDRLQQRSIEELLVDTPHLAGVPAPLGGELRHRIRAQA